MTRPLSKPRWATVDTYNGPGGQINWAEPDATKKNIGWNYLEKPAREYANWLHKNTYDWFDYLDTEVNQFAVFQSDVSAPDMTVKVTAGRLNLGTTLVTQSEQTSGTITAPTTNDRIDRVLLDITTAVISILTGSESASPSPASIPAGKTTLAQIYLTPATTEITNDDLTDERTYFQKLGLSASDDEVITGSWSFDGNHVEIGSSAPGNTWATNAVEINDTGALSAGTGIIDLVENAYNDGSWKYTSTSHASRVSLSAGNIDFYTAPSNTADTAITWTEMLKIQGQSYVKTFGSTLISPDKLDITPDEDLHLHKDGVNAATLRFTNVTSSTSGFNIGIEGAGAGKLWMLDNFDISVKTNDTFRGKFSDSGNWLISPDGLDITPAHELVLYSGSSGQSFIQFANNTTASSASSGMIVGIDGSEVGFIYNYENTDLKFGTNNLQEMYLDASNRGVVVGNPTGAGKGAGSINAESIYLDGTALSNIGRYFTSGTTPSISAGSSYNFTVTHGLGTNDVLVQIICSGNDVSGQHKWKATIGFHQSSAADVERLAVFGSQSSGLPSPNVSSTSDGQLSISIGNDYSSSQTIDYRIIVIAAN